jgi:hypothetical protein
MEGTMKHRKTKAEKVRDALITRTYNTYFDRVPVNMLDIPKIYKEIQAALELNDTVLTHTRLNEIKLAYERRV